MNATNLANARAVADAVLYEGYLLYPYRANSAKNQSRWQFGVLGPPGAAEAGYGEDPALAAQFLLRGAAAALTFHLRFLQLQQRSAQRADEAGEFTEVPELVVGEQRWLTWDEAVERELTAGPWTLDQLAAPRIEPMGVPAGEDIEVVTAESGAVAGRLVRRRRRLHAELHVHAEPVGAFVRLSVRVENVATDGDPATDAADGKDAAIAASFIGANLLVEAEYGQFLSMTDPPDEAADTAATCTQHRCWPVLAGPVGDGSVLLVSPIILADHPELAPESAGHLYDSTEIDELLTLRVMTMTDEEKAAARSTDARAAAIIDRCDALPPEAMQQLHGALRDPHWGQATDGGPSALDLTGTYGFDGEVPWWDPAVDASVAPDTDAVVIDGVAVASGSIVRVHPARRADAQDLFFVDRLARVAAVHSDVDGATHVALLLLDDPAAELHDQAGRYFYFAPEELEPIPEPAASAASADNRKEI